MVAWTSQFHCVSRWASATIYAFFSCALTFIANKHVKAIVAVFFIIYHTVKFPKLGCVEFASPSSFKNHCIRLSPHMARVILIYSHSNPVIRLRRLNLTANLQQNIHRHVLMCAILVYYWAYTILTSRHKHSTDN